MPSHPPSPPLRGGGPWPVWLIVGACFLTLLILVAAFYVEENWRGARAWAACQRDLAAQGETLEWSAFAPPPVPDAQNLALAPLIAREFKNQTDPKTGRHSYRRVEPSSGSLGDMPYGAMDKPQGFTRAVWDTGTHTSGWAACQLYFRQKPGFPHPDQPQAPVDDVLLALTRYAPALDELARAAATRPFTRFPLDWGSDNPFALSLPHFNLEQQFVTTLALRASALLAANRPGDAARDLELALRLCRDAGADGHTLIGHLVESTCLRVAFAPLWEGLADRRWSATELARLQANLQRFDLVADYLEAMRGERASFVRVIDYLNHHRDPGIFLPVTNLQGGPSSFRQAPFAWLAVNAAPRGWFDLSKEIACRYEQSYYIGAADAKAHRFLPGKLAAGQQALAAMPNSPVTYLARLALPVFGSIAIRAAKVQTGLDHAVVACALERFYLDRQAYPARLEELVPAYLARVPSDVIDGAPMRYGQTPDGRYRLYGVGWNGRDEDGKVVFGQRTHLDETAGDWVWQYTSLLPPPPAAPAK